MTGPRSPIILPRWDLNPVVVKELRQAVRNWFVVGVLLILLLILFVAMVMYLLSESIGATANPTLGRNIFQVFYTILTLGSMLFIPIYTGTRFAKEREDSNMDLMFITTLTPGQIIRGKILGGVILTGLFYSVFLPFMSFCYLLRGVDLPSMFVVLAMSFIVVTAMIHLSVCLACLPVSRNFKGGIGAATFFLSLSWIGGMSFGGISMIETGIGSKLASWDFWGPALTFVIGAALVMRVLYIAAVALITPPSANRALPLRVNTTVCYLIAVAIPLAWDYFGGSIGTTTSFLPQLSAGFGLPLLAVCLLACISSRDKLSLRIRRTIPATQPKRALAFIFYDGAAGGLVWCALLACFMVPLGYLAFGKTAADWEIYAATALYFFAYALTGLFLHRRFWRNRPPKLAGICAVLVPLLLGVIPTLVLFFLNRFTYTSRESFMPGNIFNLFVNHNSHAPTHCVVATVWVVVMLALNAPWFLAQFLAFQPLNPAGEKAADGSTLPPRID